MSWPPRTSRRAFLAGSLAASATLLSCGSSSSSDFSPSGGARSSTGDVRRYGSLEVVRGEPAADAPNILMLVLDDQNDWVGFLDGHPGAVTPNLDRLAARSMVFEHAYCPAPMCRPSRTAVLFGRHPHVTGLYDHSDDSDGARRGLDQLPSLADDLWAAGYDTFRIGKVYGSQADQRFDERRPTAWFVGPGEDIDSGAERDPDWIDPYTGRPYGERPRRSQKIDFGPSGRTPEDQPGTESADAAVEVLRRDRDRPFFLALGLVPPHVPWRVPQQFFDLHPLDEVQVPAYFEDDLDDLGPTGRELAAFPGAFERIRDAGLLPEAVQAYQAATSYVDWAYGRVLDALDQSPHADNTLVVVWSDHGFHMGEKLHFHKMALWEPATRIPFLITDPRDSGLAGRFPEPVSTIDLGPTLAQRCGFEIHGPHDGGDLQPLLDDPSTARDRPPLMTWLEGNHAVRRDQWRYIRYAGDEEELYDLGADPDEHRNLAFEAEYDDIKEELAGYLPD